MVNKFHIPGQESIIRDAQDVIRGTNSMPSMQMQQPPTGKPKKNKWKTKGKDRA